MKLSTTDAATFTDTSKSTIQRLINSGKLSGQRNDSGHFEIDKSELCRFFNINPDRQFTASNMNQDASIEPKVVHHIDATDKIVIKSLQEQLELTKTMLNESKEREQRLLGILESNTRLIEHQKETPKKRKFFFF